MTWCERRKEQRRAASGELRLVPETPGAVEVRARLVDRSASGFRAAHGCPGLGAGNVVAFYEAAECGRARVMWTRVVGAEAESGFLVLE